MERHEERELQPTGDEPAKGAEAQLGAADADTASLLSQLEEQKDRVLRLQAELQNVRSRAARELADERRYGALPLMRDVVPVMDNIDRAIEAAEKNDDARTLIEGFRLVRQQLATVLSQHRCESIDALGQPFDPDVHEAILQQPSQEHEAGHVMMVTQPGYRLHERVVRPAQVIVAGGAPAPERTDDNRLD
jgi:molecular chaperone GrpE